MKVGLPVTLVHLEYRWCSVYGSTHTKLSQKVGLAPKVTFSPFCGHGHVHGTAISKCATNWGDLRGS